VYLKKGVFIYPNTCTLDKYYWTNPTKWVGFFAKHYCTNRCDGTYEGTFWKRTGWIYSQS